MYIYIQMTNEYNTLLQEKEKADILLLQSKQSIHQCEETVKRLIDYQNSIRLLTGTMPSVSHINNSNNSYKVKELIIQVCIHIYLRYIITAPYIFIYIYLSHDYYIHTHILIYNSPPFLNTAYMRGQSPNIRLRL